MRCAAPWILRAIVFATFAPAVVAMVVREVSLHDMTTTSVQKAERGGL